MELLAMKLLAILLLAVTAAAQDPPRVARKASISGTVRYAGWTAPVADANVTVDTPDGVVYDKTTPQGRYTLRDLPPGRYRLQVTKAGGRALSRLIVLAGFDLNPVDIQFQLFGTLAGRVFDDRNEPAAGVSVFLVRKTYYLGQAQNRRILSATTNHRGSYRIPGVPTGETLMVLATRTAERVADASDDPKQRPPVLADTWFPDLGLAGSGSTITLRPGQSLDPVDIHMVRTPSYCAEGRMVTGGGAPASMSFLVWRTETTALGAEPLGSAGATKPDGTFRTCGLAPGDYRIGTASPTSGDQPATSFAIASFAIVDQDVAKLVVTTPSLVPLAGETAWDVPAAGTVPGTKIVVRALPTDRRIWTNGTWNELQGAASEVPGRFRFPDLLLGDYEISVLGLAPGQYLKDVTYGGGSVLHQPLHLGNATGNWNLRLAIAGDGGTLSAQVRDGDGKPLIDAYVYLLPDSALSEAALADVLVWGQTDQYGRYTSDTIPPGRYRVLVVPSGVGEGAAAIQKLWLARLGQGTEIEIGPGANREVTLAPVEIR
jgi:hypothetical protein